MSKKKSNHYVDNDELREEIVKCKANGQLTQRAAEMLELMAHRIARVGPYRDAELRKDCIAHAMCDVCYNWFKYDPIESDNAFAFFTRMITNGLTAGLHENAHKLGTTHLSIEQLLSGNNSD